MFTFLCLIAGVTSAKKTKELTTHYGNALIFAYSPVNSVYEDDNIKLEIYNQKLYATNKTKKTIFIDPSQCFLVNNGSSYPMYSKQQNEKYASKVGVAGNDVFITIAPATGAVQNETFVCDMTKDLYGSYESVEGNDRKFSEYDKRFLNVIGELATESLKADPEGKKCMGTVTRHLTEDESINNIGATIAYAFNNKNDDWTTIEISTWVSDVILAPYYIEMPKELSKNEKKGFGVKETSPAIIHLKANTPFEFDEDKSPIVACVWKGNFKKGSFDVELLAAAPWWSNPIRSILHFDGNDADWGIMKYTRHSANTMQGVE